MSAVSRTAARDLADRPARRAPWIAAGILLAVAAAYAPVVRYGFVNFDDPDYVTRNALVQQGLTRAGVVWAFATFHAANWHPLTWLSHMLDCQLFGLAAAGHHATSVVLHAGAALLLFAALARMTGAVWRSAMVAALFALHPLRVESVAWISERKDVLSTFFWMATLVAYARWVERPAWPRYAALLLAFAAALLAKPMAVTLPFALLLLDAWPLGRLFLPGRGWRLARRPLVEKLPLLALAAAASALTFLAQERAGAVSPLAVHPLAVRLANALLSYAAYLAMTVWPRGLAIFYPYRGAFPLWKLAASALLLGTISALVARKARRAPWLLVGWLWYLGTLVPVIGIVGVGDQAMADRFTYVPQVGLLVMTVWGLAEATRGWNSRRLLLPAAAGLALTACAVGTRLQLGHWHDSLALFGRALAVTESPLAHTNYAFALLDEARVDEALAHFRRALALRPRDAKAHLNFGLGLATIGRADDAIVEYRAAIALDQRYVAAHYNLGLELAEQGRFDDAVAAYREALRLDPRFADAHNNLGLALARQGRTAEALGQYQEALTLDPRLAAAHSNIAVVLERLGRPDDAMAHYRDAVALAPDDARAHFNLGAALAAREHHAEAATEYRTAVRLRPDLVEGHVALAATYAAAGRFRDAAEAAQHALAVARAMGREQLAAEIERQLAAWASGRAAPRDPAEAAGR